MTPERRLYRIVEEGACTGCGLCEAVAGHDRVQVRRVQTGYERPVVTDPLDHETVDRIYDVCPATRWAGAPEARPPDGTTIDPYWGPWRRWVLAHAADPEVRLKAATGGILTALGMFLIDSGRVDFVLHARAADDEPTYGEPSLSFKSDAVRRGTSSIYFPTAPLRAAEEALAAGRTFAFIGKPCDIVALRNLSLFDDRVNRLVRAWLTPVCGGWTTPDAMADFLAQRGLTGRDLASFRHRGDGCPGLCEFESQNGQRFTSPMNEPFGGSGEANWKIPFRCKLCPDGGGEAADITAGDIREGGEQKWEDSEVKPGTNAVVVRTPAGEELFDAAIAVGYITVTAEISPRWYDCHQEHLVRKKCAMRARFDGMAAEGRLVPRTSNLRLDALSHESGMDRYNEEMTGTRDRIRRGDGTEPTPTAPHRDA